MKRFIFIIFSIVNIYVCAFGSAPIVNGATNVGTYAGYNLYYYEKGNPEINCGIFGGNLYSKTCTLYMDDNLIQTTTFSPGYITFNLNDNWLTDYKIHKFNVKLYIYNDPVYIRKITPAIETVCSQTPHIIAFISTGSILKLQKSNNSGISWQDIVWTNEVYTETNPTAGTYLYRAINGDGTYSDIKQVTYQDAVPSSLIATPASNTKTVDETLTLGLSTTNATYNYQWNLNGTAISGATSATYSIPVIKAAHAGSYKCTVSNGCNSITSAAASLTVNKAAQVITFPDIATKTIADSSFTLPATTDKGLTISYQSTNTAVATINGKKVTIVAPGTSNIIASQSGTADYLAATGVTKTLTVNKIAQTITLSATATKTYGDTTFPLTAYTNKGKIITYSSSNTAVATVSGNTVTIKGAGTTDLVGTHAGDMYYYPAPNATQTLTVNKAVQTITFGAIATKTYGDAAITLPTVTDKGLTISYSSSDATVASVSGNSLTINKAGTATITATQVGSSNYLAATQVQQVITINKANQTIVWSNIPNKTYGDADFTLPATTDKGLTITYTCADPTIATVTGNTVSVKAAGTVNITASQAGTVNYNAASSVTLPLTISKAAQTITFADLPACTFGGAALTLAATSSSGLTVTYESSDYNVATPTGNTLALGNAGQCYITASVAGNGNYLTGTPVQKLLTVSKANQTITFDAIPDKTYGDAAFSLTASSNTSSPVTFSSSTPAKLIISGTTATIAGAGSFTVTASQAGTSNYNAATATRTFTVNKAMLIATADNKIRVYGDANPVFTISYSGFVNGDSKYELAVQPVGSTTATATSIVGDYSITLSSITVANYTLVNRNGIISITQAPLMVTAQATSKNYGEDNPIFILNYSGFKNNETSAILTSLPEASTVAKIMSSVGNYDIIVSGGTATNYALSYTNGIFSIGKYVLKVYATDITRLYGEENPTFTMNITGYKGSDDVSVLTALPTASCSAVATSAVGAYNITYSGATADNYQFDYVSTVGKLNVTKAPLMVTADNLTKEYGNANPTLTYKMAGFKNSETSSALTTLPTITTTALMASNVGSYDITVGGGSSSNYSFSYTSAKLNITNAPLTVSGVNATKIYGDANPTFTFNYSGFKNNETSSVISIQPTAYTIAKTMSNVGTYDIVVSGAVAANYALNYINGTLTVNKAILKVYALGASRKYGEANPNFTMNVTGYKGADNVSVFIDLPTASCYANATSPVGNYNITFAGATADNYQFDYTTTVGKLNVTKAPLMVTADNLTKEYGNANPTLTYSYAGFKNSETDTVFSIKPTITTTALIVSNVGMYNITVSGGIATNYSLSYTNAKLTINKAPLIATAVNTTKVYGNNNPTLSVSYSGFKNNQTETDLTTAPTVLTTAIAMSKAGDYDILVGGGAATNYQFTYINGKLTITKAPLIVSVKNDSIFKGSVIPSFTLVYSGFKGNDDVSLLDILPSPSCSATSASPFGKYDIVLQGGSDKNYNYTLRNGVFTIKDNTGIYNVNEYNTTLYPVPATDKIFIQSDVSISKAEIYSVNGQLMQIKAGHDLKSLDISGLIKGSYTVRIFSEDKAIFTRMILKK